MFPRPDTPLLRDAHDAGRIGLSQAVEAAGPSWLELAIEAVRQACLDRPVLISDDVWATGLQSNGHDRALGQAMKEGVRRGWMVKTGRMRPSVRSHGSPKPEYRSLLYQWEPEESC